VRTVLTEEKDTAFYPPASLETASLATERQFYSGEDSGRVNKSSVAGYPTDTYTNPNDYIQQLSGNGYKIGTGIVLKVMAGDHVNIHVSSWYKTNGATPGTPINPLNDLLAALYSGIGSAAATHGTTATQLQSSGVLTPGATNFLSNRSYTSTIPKAYLNWVLFDDQFKMVSSGSGAQQVGADNTFTTMVQNGLTAAKNGYLYVYVSNETPNINVYFDNLQVTHIKGPLLQEQSYYPFGLEMAGISDQSMGKLDSKNKFNGGVELEEDYGVNLYSTFYRKYDPQIGRFSGVDCQSEASMGMSVYQFAGNNPVSLNDPLGNKMTAGLWDRGNFYYDFPGEHHQQQSADPLAGTFMDAGNGGGSGYGYKLRTAN
jgi:RHS repeat-associated protein